MSNKKLRYRNFNICQLVDKGKLKLQYLDEFEGNLKKYAESTAKITNVEKKVKKDKLNREEQIISIPYIPEFPYLMNHNLNICHGYIDRVGCALDYNFLKEKVKFLEITNKNVNEYAILIMEGFIFGNDKLRDINVHEEENKISEDIYPYLVEFDMVKKLYTHDDLIRLLTLYVSGKRKEKNKQLVKE